MKANKSIETHHHQGITYQRKYSKCNKAACFRCTTGAGGHGPYWYKTFRNNGKVITKYVGKWLKISLFPENKNSLD